MGKPLLLKIFQVLCLIIVGLATIVLLIVIFGYVGILSPEQIESLDKLGTGVLNQKSSWAVVVDYFRFEVLLWILKMIGFFYLLLSLQGQFLFCRFLDPSGLRSLKPDPLHGEIILLLNGCILSCGQNLYRLDSNLFGFPDLGFYWSDSCSLLICWQKTTRSL